MLSGRCIIAFTSAPAGAVPHRNAALLAAVPGDGTGAAVVSMAWEFRGQYHRPRPPPVSFFNVGLSPSFCPGGAPPLSPLLPASLLKMPAAEARPPRLRPGP